MGFRRLTFLLSVGFALSLAACGDNKLPVFEDAMTDAEEEVIIDAPPDALMCGAAPNMNCGGTCKDTSNDEANCGACGTACGSGQTCDTGVCCDAGKVNCGGVCVDLTIDNNNCGICAEACDTGAGESCTNSTCCGGNQTSCPGGQCFNTETNDNHCGDCATMCGVNEGCSAGHCCADGLVWCGPDVGGACVDPLSDEANCGACSPANGGTGDVCVNTESCSNGLCCAAGTIKCGNACVDVNSDEANCGACSPANGGTGAVCTTNPLQTCDDGICCGPGLINCGGACVDPQSSEAHCGGCAGTLGAEVCDSGEICLGGADPSCCGPGQINCGGTCINPQNDNANCGGCAGAGGMSCPVGSPVCSGGACAAGCGPNEINCNGDCVDPNSNHTNCGGCSPANGGAGDVCDPLEVCADGTCGTVCPAGETNCAGQCVNLTNDPNFCGNCSNTCSAINECVNGACQLDCPQGETLCNGVCRNLLTDEMACGACGAAFCTGTCENGLCCPTGTIRCGNSCVNITNNPQNCGGCAGQVGADVCNTAANPPEQCKPDGMGGGECCFANENVCNGACSDPLLDENNCGGCGMPCSGDETCDGGICCGEGEENVDGICCPTGFIACGPPNALACFNPATSNTHCGMCNTACVGQFCQAGTCQTACLAPNENGCGLCTNQDTDPDFCGVGCVDCPTGAACVDSQPGAELGVGAACAACPTGPALGCNGQCTNTNSDNNNCGGCAGAGGAVCNTQAGQTCTGGLCCQANEIVCNGQCVNPQTNGDHCGGCNTAGGTDCTGTQTCTSGTCGCPFGQITCGGNCVTPAVDRLNCGTCGNACGVGQNAGKPFCVSNGCAASCPAPLVACGNQCVNPDSSNTNCGSCGNTCSSTQGCVAGTCRTKLVLTPDPVLNPALTARCVGGGPPISVPGDNGTQICTGNLAGTSFTFGMCSRTQLDVPASIFTDAFNSNFGPHRPVGLSGANRACLTDTDCGTGGICRGAGTAADPAVCIGGGVGVNGTVGPIAKTQQNTHIGGSFWAFGTIGLDISKTTIVKQKLYNEGPFKYASTGHKVYEDAYINGPFSTTGNPSFRIDGRLTSDVAGCPPTGATGMTVGGGCTRAAWDQALLAPCGEDSDLNRPGGWDIPVKSIVEYFRNPARNDNKAIGLRYDAVSNAAGPVRLELNCGNYYLDSLRGSQEVTIVVRGRAALYVGGAADINVEMIFDVEPTGSVDMFIGGVVNIAHSITLGSPAYPRLTRMYIGSPSTAGGGASCTSVSDCSSGLCSACPAVSATFTGYAPCSTTPGTCGSGTGRSPSINMSQGGFFNGLLWAGYGGFSTSNAVEIYGSLFAGRIGASGDLKIHYDNGAVTTADECPPPAPNGQCESCRDCGNQPCGANGLCQTSCTADNQCCPPLRCDIGGTNRCVL